MLSAQFVEQRGELQKQGVLEQNALIHKINSENNGSNIPLVIIMILIFVVLALAGIFAYFYFTR